jgi:hypothetical protein
LEARNFTITTQTTDLVGRETVASRSFPPLAIEDAGDHIIGIKRGEAAQQ